MTFKHAFILCTAMSVTACAGGTSIKGPDALPKHWAAEAHYPEPDPTNRASTFQRPPSGGAITGSEATSLWSSAPKSLFGDRRASQAGDILTVVVEIDEEATLENSVVSNRQTSQNLNVNALFGAPQALQSSLPDGASFSPAVDLARSGSVNGNGNITRSEEITLRLAARVTDVMPNGYLRIAGRQEIIVNNETRYLQVTGLARVQDITRLNTITYDKIAEARIFYGGQGQMTDTVKPRVGNKLLNKLLPF